MEKTSQKKSVLFIILIAFIAISVFGTAAVCNMCGASDETDESGKIDVDRTDEGSASSDQSASGDGDSGTGAESTDGQGGEPTVELEVYMGPEYIAAQDLCFYRVEARVKGDPLPDKAVFSRDDSNGAWGLFKAQVNLTMSEPEYTLTATVTTSKDTDTDSIDLSWECDGINRDPEITAINLSETNPSVDEQYAVTAVASDPDGDDLEYKWSVSAGGGTIANDTTNPMQWKTPNATGTYTIEVTITDGKGGTVTETKDVDVGLPAPPPIADVYLTQVISEGGYIEKDGWVNKGGCVYAGDSGNPGAPDPAVAGYKPVRGFVSFDISGLAGATIKEATLFFDLKKKSGDPSTFGNVHIEKVYWGPEQLVQDDFDLGKDNIISYADYGNGNYKVTAQTLEDLLQDSIKAGDPRFQIRIRFGVGTDNDGIWDGLEYDQDDVSLQVVYEY
jgi:hypothetical protein